MARSDSPKAKARAAKEALFIEAYLSNGGNGAKAYVEAGFRAKSVNVAAVEAHKLLKKPNVANEIARRNEERLAKAKATSDEVVISAARVLRFDPRNLVHRDGKDKGKAKPLEDLDEDTALAADVVELPGGMKVRVNRGAAREQLMKHLGLFEADNKQKPVAAIVHTPGSRSAKFQPLRARKAGA